MVAPAPGRPAPPAAPEPPVSPFQVLFNTRVKARSFEQLSFVEVFAGTAGLTSAVRQIGFGSAVGIDHVIAKRAMAPVLHLDLLQPPGQQLLWDMLRRPGVAFVHLGPPCGTSSRARDIANGGPPPLRSASHPDGRPHLAGPDLARVQAANQLYALSAEVTSFCCSAGILCTLENPSRFWAWSTSNLRQPLHPWAHQLVSVHLHACMFGSRRRKATKLLTNHPGFLRLQLTCDGSHEHEPWGHQAGMGHRPGSGLSPSLSSAGPGPWPAVPFASRPKPCRPQILLPNIWITTWLGGPCRRRHTAPWEAPPTFDPRSQARGAHPWAGPTPASTPPRCKEDAPFPPGLQATPPLAHLPAGARLLHTQLLPGDGARENGGRTRSRGCLRHLMGAP